MMNRKLLLPVLAACSTMVSACNEDGYLFYRNPPPPIVSNVSHKIKHLEGNSMVDIVWVIDNSGSMGAHQANVIANTQVFMDQFSKNGQMLDWKMGLVSTDAGDMPYVGFLRGTELTSKTPNPTAFFQAAVNRLGTMGSAEEEGFVPLLRGLQLYPDFVRPKSTLAVIFVTDAQEQGVQDVSTVLREMAAIKDPKQTVAYGIFWTRDLGCSRNSGEEDWELKDSRYGQFVDQFGGKSYPLCDSNFGASLADLGKDLVSRITAPRLFLDSRPRVSTLKVLHQGREIPAGLPGQGGYWYYDQRLNALVFHDLSFAPGDEESVQVVYDEDNGLD